MKFRFISALILLVPLSVAAPAFATEVPCSSASIRPCSNPTPGPNTPVQRLLGAQDNSQQPIHAIRPVYAILIVPPPFGDRHEYETQLPLLQKRRDVSFASAQFSCTLFSSS